MKKIIIILSLVISAFIMACSDSATRLQTKVGVGSQKTLADLEKASSEQELSKLKKQLESDPSVEVIDIIRAVKLRFGARAKTLSKEEQLKDKKDKSQRIYEAAKSEEKIKNLEEQSDFSDILLVENDNPLNAVITTTNDTETIHMCIKTCDTQIIVSKEMTAEGKLQSIDVFVAHEIKKENVVLANSSLKNKDIKSILALYSVKGNKMLLTFSMLKSGKDMILSSEEFVFDEKTLPSVKFVSAASDESGTLQVMKNAKVKTIRMDFDIEKDTVILKLINDSGLFGKNLEASADSKAAGQGKALEQGEFKRF